MKLICPLIIKIVKKSYFKCRKCFISKKVATAKIKANQAQNGEQNLVDNAENDTQVKKELRQDQVSSDNYAKNNNLQSIRTTNRSIESSFKKNLAPRNSLPPYDTLNKNQKY